MKEVEVYPYAVGPCGLFAVGVGGFFGHIDHKSVFHFVVVAVSAACNELVVERIVRVVPLALVCVVDGFGKRNDAGGHIVFVAARRIHFAARPACDSARIVGGFCVDNLEVAVFDEQTFGFGNRRVVLIRFGSVVVARNEQRR